MLSEVEIPPKIPGYFNMGFREFGAKDLVSVV
jgi:hypothetical protein